MAIIKDLIYEYLETSKLIKDCQTGSAKGRRVQDNIKILDYCINNTYKTKKVLYALAIDFAKAFDSVDRKMLIKILKEYKINAEIIQIISEIYQGDWTELNLNNEKVTNIDVTGGVRQGCGCSALLFTIVTYYIIDKIKENNTGYSDDEIQIQCLFYADDAVILAQERSQLEKMIVTLEKAADECGLKLNREKCKILKFNGRDEEANIKGLELVKEIKYLGIKITNNRMWYKEQVKRSIETGAKINNFLYSVIGKTCNKLMIGKVFWKSVATPKFMYGQEIIPYTKADIAALQRIDNKAYRTILGLPMYTAEEFLRGEVGASTMEARDMKNKINYLKYALYETKNNLLKNIIKIEIRNNSKWYKITHEYMNKINLTQEDLRDTSNQRIKNLINEWDTLKWKTQMINKKTLTIYRTRKRNIREEKWFNNNRKCNIMMKARSDTLQLGWREFGMDDTKICKMCNIEIETLEHFLLDCQELQETRNFFIELQRPLIKDRNNLIGRMLIFEDEGKTEYYLKLLEKLWIERERKLKDRGNNNMELRNQ